MKKNTLPFNDSDKYQYLKYRQLLKKIGNQDICITSFLWLGRKFGGFDTFSETQPYWIAMRIGG